MSSHPTAEILTIGDELLRGDLVDTNGPWLAQRLGQLGVEVTRKWSLGDDLDAIVSAVREAAQRARFVLISGGLGPTDDDRTTEAVAGAAEVPVDRNDKELAKLRARFEAAGFSFTSNNEKQARFPRGATVLANRKGTAPGFRVAVGDANVFCMPGVPREMTVMFDREVGPRLIKELGTRPAVVRTVKLFGVAESHADADLAGLLDVIDTRGCRVSVHFRATFPEIHLVFVVRGADTATAVANALEAEVRRRLGRHVFGTDDETFSTAIVAGLRRAGVKVALAESCTGGLLGDLLTRASGASDVFELGTIAYANHIKHAQLDVPIDVLETHGAVSRACVEAMAVGVRGRAGATYGVAVSGIAGPDGGSEDKPVGTVHFAVAGPDGVRHLHRVFRYGRERTRLLSAYVALWLLYRRVETGLEDEDPLHGRWAARPTQK